MPEPTRAAEGGGGWSSLGPPGRGRSPPHVPRELSRGHALCGLWGRWWWRWLPCCEPFFTTWGQEPVPPDVRVPSGPRPRGTRWRLGGWWDRVLRQEKMREEKELVGGEAVFVF